MSKYFYKYLFIANLILNLISLFFLFLILDDVALPIQSTTSIVDKSLVCFTQSIDGDGNLW